MHGPFGNSEIVAREIQGQFHAGQDKIVTRMFGAVAKLLWPIKTAACLAEIAGVEERTAKRWISGEFEPPGIVLAAVLVQITKRS